jgi:hypothetical protein
MRTSLARCVLALAVLLLGSVVTARADIKVRLSVKFIHNSDGAAPGGAIASTSGFDAEVIRGNRILQTAGRGYILEVVEYLDIQPAAPAGQSADYWYSLDARENRQTFEDAAIADKNTWEWNDTAINIYVNNSSSGQCSLVGQGGAISLGGTIGAGTVLHEVGHVFNLMHTHGGDYADNPNTPPYVLSDLRNGDALASTAPDNPNIRTQDELCGALYGRLYSAATAQQQADVDSAFLNVMSYHMENKLLPDQMDIWALNANGARLEFCSGRTWFVADSGSDSNSGESATSPLRTLSRALSRVASPDDILLLRSGTFLAPAGRITTRCTLRSTAGSAVIRI